MTTHRDRSVAAATALMTALSLSAAPAAAQQSASDPAADAPRAAAPGAEAAPETETGAEAGTGPAAEAEAPAVGLPDLVELAPVTLFATRTPTQVLDAPANVTVIGGEQVERRMSGDMQELIRNQPGIVVNRQTTGTDAFNSFGGFTIRGVGGNRVQILVDGSRVPERITDGTRDFLDLDFLSRAEIVRGPGSVLWGSDALGGIVALETVDPEELLEPGERWGGRISASYDSLDHGIDDSAMLAVRVTPTISLLGGISHDVAEEARLGRARADGGDWGCPRNLDYGATPCNKLNPTDMRETRGLAKMVFTPTPDHRFELSADVMTRKTEVENDYVLGPTVSSITGAPTGEVVLDDDRERDLDRSRFAISHDWRVGADWLDALSWTFAYAPQGYDTKGTDRVRNADGETVVSDDTLSFSEDFLELDVQFNSSFQALGAEHRLTYGFDGDYTKTDYSRASATRNLDTGETTETRGGGFNFANADTVRADVYVQDEISLFDGRLELSPGLRYATYSLDPRPNADYDAVPGEEPEKVSDQELTAKLGALLRLDRRFSIYGNYGQGFKMPTAQQLYTSLPGSSFNLVPAPDLKPEKVNSYEIGLRGQFDRGWFSVDAFYADYDDFIQSFYNPPGTNDYTYRNLSEVQIWGIEGSGELALTRNLTATGSLSWQRGVQRASPGADADAFDVAPLTATLGLGYDIPRHGLEFDAVATLAADVDRTSNADAFRPDGYAVFDLYAAWEVTEGVRLNAAMLNVLDSRYFEWPMPNTYSRTTSDSVARTNPLELQTAPGRTFRLGLSASF